MEDFLKYKWFFTTDKSLVVGGKSSSQNDSLISKLKKEGKDYVVMHTASPGSPFSVILKDISQVSSSDKEECAMFTACFSKAWKAKSKKVKIHVFNLSQLFKSKSMNEGTWGVKGKVHEMTIDNMVLTLTKQEGVLRAVPKNNSRKKKISIIPGSIDKTDLLAKLEIEYNEPLSMKEVLSALPAGGISIKSK